MQIVFAFLLSSIFHSNQTAMVFALLWVFATGLIANSLFRLELDRNLWYVHIIELIPAFGAYRYACGIKEHMYRQNFIRILLEYCWSALWDVSRILLLFHCTYNNSPRCDMLHVVHIRVLSSLRPRLCVKSSMAAMFLWHELLQHTCCNH